MGGEGLIMSVYFGHPPWIPIHHPDDDPSIPRCCVGNKTIYDDRAVDVNGRCKCECHGDDEAELFLNWRTP